jgi:hypothetical protein
MLHHRPFSLELSRTAADRHRGFSKAVNARGIDTASCCGAMLRDVCDALSLGKRGGYARSAAELESPPSSRLGPVTSYGRGLVRLAHENHCDALKERFPGQAARGDTAM